MALKIRHDAIYSSDGQKLKKIHCPHKVDQADLEKRNDGHFDCRGCKKKVVNTDFMSERQLISLLLREPDVCLFINSVNPLFEVVD